MRAPISRSQLFGFMHMTGYMAARVLCGCSGLKELSEDDSEQVGVCCSDKTQSQTLPLQSDAHQYTDTQTLQHLHISRFYPLSSEGVTGE